MTASRVKAPSGPTRRLAKNRPLLPCDPSTHQSLANVGFPLSWSNATCPLLQMDHQTGTADSCVITDKVSSGARTAALRSPVTERPSQFQIRRLSADRPGTEMPFPDSMSACAHDPSKSARGPAVYQPRRPERSMVYQVVEKHLETWLEMARAGDGYEESVPAYIEHDFRQYLTCGIRANGFARARCAPCGNDLLVAFSCKGRRLPLLQHASHGRNGCPSGGSRVSPGSGAAVGLIISETLAVFSPPGFQLGQCGPEAVLSEDVTELLLGWKHRGGFSLNAEVWVPSWDRAGLEPLLRYCARPKSGQSVRIMLAFRGKT
jgi:Transposase zinc-binding domain